MTEHKAIFFDQDGVIVDTERDGHRIAFNQTFREFGYNFQWGVEEYHNLLQVGGGKERMRHYLHTQGFGTSVPPENEEDLIRRLHKRKTERFIQMIGDGTLPLRPGVHRLMKEARQAGWRIGICTTSNEKTAQMIVSSLLSDIHVEFVLAGDIVSQKKPAPDIYLLALEKSGLSAAECVVIEDSHIGVTAARAAGMAVVATTNVYTAREDLSAADLVVSSLGDHHQETGRLMKGSVPDYDGVLNLAQIQLAISAKK